MKFALLTVCALFDQPDAESVTVKARALPLFAFHAVLSDAVMCAVVLPAWLVSALASAFAPNSALCASAAALCAEAALTAAPAGSAPTIAAV